MTASLLGLRVEGPTLSRRTTRFTLQEELTRSTSLGRPAFEIPHDAVRIRRIDRLQRRAPPFYAVVT
jgi:hypothetical protein